MIVDLTSHQLLDILPTRNKEDVTAWLKQYPEIQVVSRDGSKTYAKAIKAACCDIKQVGDRWHILKQLFDAVKKTIYDYVPSRWIPPEKNPPSSNQEQNQEFFLRKTDLIRLQNEEKRWKRIQAVQEMASQNYSIAAIARLINISRNTVYQDLKTFQKPSHKREPFYDEYRSLIRALIQKEQKAKHIEAACRARGYKGSTSTLNTMIATERRCLKEKRAKPLYLRQKLLSMMWNFTIPSHKAYFKHIHPQLLATFPDILLLDELVFSFRQLFYSKNPSDLIEWIERYERSHFSFIHSFITGLRQDLPAVLNSVQEPWSNGVVEGHVNRLKTIKRMMYGRASFPLLRKRLLLGP
ncbi:transposase [Domibacillus enclensis]|uniref:transposase n=1 Tax=Domibacillus enclensis TaxID=1017273 RepID=UPI002F3F0009